jgi:hypothetical protein
MRDIPVFFDLQTGNIILSYQPFTRSDASMANSFSQALRTGTVRNDKDVYQTFKEGSS